MKIKSIKLSWNNVTGRVRKSLILPRRDKYDTGIPTELLAIHIELIEEFRVLGKFVIGDLWCFAILDEHDTFKIVYFDDEGLAQDASIKLLEARFE